MRRASEAVSESDVRAIAPIIQALDGLGRRARVDGSAGAAAENGEVGADGASQALGVSGRA